VDPAKCFFSGSQRKRLRLRATELGRAIVLMGAEGHLPSSTTSLRLEVGWGF
jgi:hypothetical protein